MEELEVTTNANDAFHKPDAGAGVGGTKLTETLPGDGGGEQDSLDKQQETDADELLHAFKRSNDAATVAAVAAGEMDANASKWEDILGAEVDAGEIERVMSEMLEEELNIPLAIESNRRDRNLGEIAELKDEMKDANTPEFVEQLREECEGKVVLVGSIDVVDIELEEQRIEKQRIECLKKDAERQRRLLKDIALREVASKHRILQETRRETRRVRLREQQLIRLHEANLREQQIAFRHAESRLRRVLAAKSGVLSSYYGELETADDLYGSARARRFRIEWALAPRPIRIRIDLIRAVKNKLSAGRYVMLVTLHDRLGGVPLHFSALKSSRWTGSTRSPVRHAGRFHDLEMSFAQDENRIFLACPAASSTRPSMVLMFELFLCRGRHSPYNRVVAWGAFPMSTPDAEVISGKFKVPLLRGEVDRSVIKYEQIEQRLRRDLDKWMANLYFDVRHLPRHLKNQKDFEVFMSFSDQLLRLRQQRDLNKAELSTDNASKHIDGDELESVDDGTAKRDIDEHNSIAEAASKHLEGGAIEGARHDGTDEHSSSDEDTVHALLPLNADDKDRDDARFGRVQEIVRFNEKRSLFDEEASGEGRHEKMDSHVHASSRARQLEQYKFHLSQEHTMPSNELSERATYLKSELIAELSLNRWRTFEFWLMVALLLAVAWFRLYTHYFAEFSLLHLMRVPVLEFSAKGHTMVLVYPTDNMDLSSTMALSIIGPAFNLFIFSILVFVAVLSQAALETFPDTGSRIVFAAGISAVLDPILVLIVDCATFTWTGDAFMLFNYFEKEEGSGVPGVFLTCFMYFTYMVMASFLFYNYLLRIHMNGRMLDVFHRLHGSPNDFFVPDDMEISLANLRWIVNKAQSWRGLSGASRKILATAFVTRDHLDPKFIEKTIHLAIYTQTMSGDRELYRHFLRRHDGTILELFDSVKIFGDEDFAQLDQTLRRHNSSQQETANQQQILDELLQQPDASVVINVREAAKSVTSANAELNTDERSSLLNK